MPAPSVRHLVKTLGAASLVGISSIVGSPIAGAMVMTVGGSIIDALAESGIDYVAANHPFRRQQALNHDLQGALQRAFATAVKRLERQWWEETGKTLAKDERQPIKTFFELLGKDAGATLSDEEIADLLYTAANIRSGDESLQHIVEKQLRSYLHGHDERLVTFMSSKLFDEIALCFSEELKTNDRAWRAYQRLVNDGLQDALRQALAKQDQIARQHAQQIDQVLGELRKRDALLESRSPEERDPWGQEALHRVHDRLAAKIAEEAECTRKTVRDGHRGTRAALHDEHEASRRANHNEHEQTRREQAEYYAKLCEQLKRLSGPSDTTRPIQDGDAVLYTSLATITQASPGAHALLKLGSFLAPQMIPLDLIGAHTDEMPEELTSVFRDPMAKIEAVEALIRHPLVDVSVDGSDERSISIDRLVQLAVRESLSEDDRRGWAEIAVRVVQSAFPFDQDRPQTWPPSERLLPHALTACKLADVGGAADAPTGKLLARAAAYLRMQSKLDQAKALSERALEIDLAAYGPNHPEVADRHNGLGWVLRDIGESADAQRQFKRALDIDLAVYGPNSRKVADRRNGLGWVLMDRRDFDGARREFEQALALDTAAYQPDHPQAGNHLAQVGNHHNGLGWVLKDLDRLDDARLEFERALAIHFAAYGRDHPRLAGDHDGLGWVLSDRRDFAGARHEMERALEIDLAAYGAEHPLVANRHAGLGWVLKFLEKFDDAQIQFQQALDSDLVTYGAQHPQVADRHRSLAWLLQDLDDLAGARHEFEQALAIYQQHHMADHTSNVEGSLRMIDEKRQQQQSMNT